MCLSVKGTDIKRDVAAFLNYFDSCDDTDLEISRLHEAETSQKISLILSSLSIAKASITHMSPGLEPLLGLHVAIIFCSSNSNPEPTTGVVMGWI